MSLDMFQCFLVYSLWELGVNLSYVELVHSAFQVYYILLLLLCTFILLISENLILKRQLKTLIFLVKQ